MKKIPNISIDLADTLTSQASIEVEAWRGTVNRRKATEAKLAEAGGLLGTGTLTKCQAVVAYYEAQQAESAAAFKAYVAWQAEKVAEGDEHACARDYETLRADLLRGFDDLAEIEKQRRAKTQSIVDRIKATSAAIALHAAEAPAQDMPPPVRLPRPDKAMPLDELLGMLTQMVTGKLNPEDAVKFAAAKNKWLSALARGPELINTKDLGTKLAQARDAESEARLAIARRDQRFSAQREEAEAYARQKEYDASQLAEFNEQRNKEAQAKFDAARAAEDKLLRDFGPKVA